MKNCTHLVYIQGGLGSDHPGPSGPMPSSPCSGFEALATALLCNVLLAGAICTLGALRFVVRNNDMLLRCWQQVKMMDSDADAGHSDRLVRGFSAILARAASNLPKVDFCLSPHLLPLSTSIQKCPSRSAKSSVSTLYHFLYRIDAHVMWLYVVSLTKVAKKTKEHKSAQITEVRAYYSSRKCMRY